MSDLDKDQPEKSDAAVMLQLLTTSYEEQLYKTAQALTTFSDSLTPVQHQLLARAKDEQKRLHEIAKVQNQWYERRDEERRRKSRDSGPNPELSL